jgi:putative Holliday junction resolvase
MAKALSIDFGLQRCGIALSDDSRTFAFGRDTVPAASLMSELKRLIPAEKVDTLVLGLPLALDGGDTDITENVRMLHAALAQEFPACHIVLLDERFTSKMAAQSMHIAGATKNQKKQKGLIDKVSATILLQNYLDNPR